MKYLTIGATAVLTALTVGPAFAAGETIAVFTKNQTNPYFQAVRVGTETAANRSASRLFNISRPSPTAFPNN